MPPLRVSAAVPLLASLTRRSPGGNVTLRRRLASKKITALLLAVALGAASCATEAGDAAGQTEMVVAASILPLADFALQVGGESVDVITLLPPGASPHTYELTPSQVAAAARARVLILNGVGLEYWAPDLVDSLDNPDLVVVDTSQGVQILEGDEHQPGGNPHIWLDPQNALVQVDHIRRALQQADPAHARTYERRAQAFASEIRALDREIAAQVATWAHTQFIAFHPAWDYFARRYGLVQAAVIEASPGREPSPADLAQVIETARRIGARAIFAEPQFSPKAAERIAEETGAQVLLLDPLGSALEQPTYLNLMRHNVAQMARGLR